MKRVNIADAKAHLSEYMRDVKRGETIIICERNVPIAEMKAYDPAQEVPRKRILGRWDGLMEIDDSVFAPMTDEEVAEFEDAPTNPLNWN
jgi:antitoxin (DNA-binding transcriptional repressor) of toxin-antitoxin stability system